MTKTITATQFKVLVTTKENAGGFDDVRIEDVIAGGQSAIQGIVEDALEYKHEVVHIITPPELEVRAESLAQLLNQSVGRESALLQSMKEQVKVEEEETEKVDQAVLDTARDFLNSQSSKIEQSKRAPQSKQPSQKNTQPKQTKEETKMNTNTTANAGKKTGMGSRRRQLMDADAPQSFSVGIGAEEIEKKTAPVTLDTDRIRNSAPGFATGSLRQVQQRHQGPWYLNAERYPVIGRLAEIMETGKDKGLGITEISIMDRMEHERFKADKYKYVLCIVALSFNGIILEFPFSLNESDTSKSPIKTSSAKFINTRDGGYWAYGKSRPNKMILSVKCGCGEYGRAEGIAGNKAYCTNCKKMHQIPEVKFNLPQGVSASNWVFETSSIRIEQDTIALAFAIANWALGYDMQGLV